MIVLPKKYGPTFGVAVSTQQMMAEIRDMNLSYLLLAQQMIRADKSMAIHRLGLSREIVEVIDGLSTAQIVKLASSPVMLTRFRFDNAAILGMLTHDRKERGQSNAHAAILLAGQPLEEIR